MTAYWSSNPLPTDVDLIAISGSNRPGEADYPPSEWLADWPVTTLVDDELGSAMQAYGLTFFPFTILVDDTGQVTTRHVGSLTGPDLEGAVSFLLGEG